MENVDTKDTGTAPNDGEEYFFFNPNPWKQWVLGTIALVLVGGLLAFGAGVQVRKNQFELAKAEVATAQANLANTKADLASTQSRLGEKVRESEDRAARFEAQLLQKEMLLKACQGQTPWIAPLLPELPEKKYRRHRSRHARR